MSVDKSQNQLRSKLLTHCCLALYRLTLQWSAGVAPCHAPDDGSPYKPNIVMNPGVLKPAGGYKCGPQQANCTLGPPPPAGGAAPPSCQDCCGDWISEDQCDKCFSQRCSGPIPKPPTPPAPTPTPPAPAPLKYACTAKLCKVDTNGTYTASDCDNKCAAHVPVPAPPTPPAPPGACNMSTGVNCWARPPCPAGTGHVAITRGEWHDKLSLLRCQWVRDRGWCLSRLSCAIRLLIRL